VHEVRPEKEPSKIGRPPPPRDGPTPQGVLHDLARWILPLLDDGRMAEGQTMVLHGGGLRW
jgi:hypothetical protein